MFSWKEFEKTKLVLSHMGGKLYRDDWGQHHLTLRPSTMLDWIKFLKEDLDFATLVEIAGVDYKKNERREFRFEIVYHFLNMGSHQRLNIHLLANENEVIPSIVDFYQHAEWYEREQKEKFTLNISSDARALLLPVNPDIQDETLLPKLRVNPNKSEAPYPEESYVWKKYDVFSTETKGNFEWLVCYDPIKVVESQVKIGFHHHGLEKLMEEKNILQLLHLVDKVRLNSAPHYSIAWAKTIEEMYRIKLPERAQAIRIVMLELARIAEHLTVLYELTAAAKMDEAKLYINAREKVYELIEKYCGKRIGLSVASIGGVKEDLPHGWIVEYQTVAEVLLKNLKTIHYALISQKKFRDLLDGSPVNAQTVLQWGVSGPAMRAAGINFDLRKSQPFYFYQDIDFDIPVGIHGSSYDRYLIRYEEIHQSLRIATQVIDNLPLGEVMNELFKLPPLEVLEVLGQQETQHRWHYSALESPAGEAGFLVQITDNLFPDRIKIKTPSFALAQALPFISKGLGSDQLTGFIASLGLSRWEMDR